MLDAGCQNQIDTFGIRHLASRITSIYFTRQGAHECLIRNVNIPVSDSANDGHIIKQLFQTSRLVRIAISRSFLTGYARFAGITRGSRLLQLKHKSRQKPHNF